MAGVILSRSKYAEKPYYITNMSINIYSLEAVSYTHLTLPTTPYV